MITTDVHIKHMGHHRQPLALAPSTEGCHAALLTDQTPLLSLCFHVCSGAPRTQASLQQSSSTAITLTSRIAQAISDADAQVGWLA